VSEKITGYESSVRGCIVIMEQPIARAPQFRSFSLNVLPRTAKNIAVELGVHGLAFGDKFMVPILECRKTRRACSFSSCGSASPSSVLEILGSSSEKTVV
jgi:hypothetical protein